MSVVCILYARYKGPYSFIEYHHSHEKATLNPKPSPVIEYCNNENYYGWFV